MKSLLPKRNRWPLLALIALAAAFAGNEAAFGQRGGQPRPGGGQMRPGGGQPGRPEPGGAIQLPIPKPQGPFVPPPPRPAVPVVRTTVYSCSNCKSQLGSGPTPPPLAQCPVCGARFVGGNGSIMARTVPGGAAPPDASSTFVFTLGIEGALLAGLVLVGLVRIASDRTRTPAPA
jgi:hypothetical protein